MVSGGTDRFSQYLHYILKKSASEIMASQNIMGWAVSYWHQEDFEKISTELFQLNNFKIPRHVILNGENAYLGNLCIRTIKNHGNIYVNLLCANGKFAPLKTLTILKLKVCGHSYCLKLKAQI